VTGIPTAIRFPWESLYVLCFLVLRPLVLLAVAKLFVPVLDDMLETHFIILVSIGIPLLFVR